MALPSFGQSSYATLSGAETYANGVVVEFAAMDGWGSDVVDVAKAAMMVSERVADDSQWNDETPDGAAAFYGALSTAWTIGGQNLGTAKPPRWDKVGPIWSSAAATAGAQIATDTAQSAYTVIAGGMAQTASDLEAAGAAVADATVATATAAKNSPRLAIAIVFLVLAFGGATVVKLRG